MSHLATIASIVLLPFNIGQALHTGCLLCLGTKPVSDIFLKSKTCQNMLGNLLGLI